MKRKLVVLLALMGIAALGLLACAPEMVPVETSTTTVTTTLPTTPPTTTQPTTTPPTTTPRTTTWTPSPTSTTPVTTPDTRPVGPQVGKLAPEFSLPALDGTPVSLESLRGRPVMLNFWATW